MNPVVVPDRRPPHAHSILFGIAVVIVLILALAIVFTDTAGAAPRPAPGATFAAVGPGRHGMGMLSNLGLGILDAAEKLNLEDDQVARLKEIRKSAPAKLMPKAQALMEARIEMQDLMREDDATPDALRQANQRLLEARTAMQQAAFDLRLQVREVLTPKQRAELKTLLRERQRVRGAPGRHRFGMQHLPSEGADLEGDAEF